MRFKKIALMICTVVFLASMSMFALIGVSADASTKSLFYSDGVRFSTHSQVPSDKISGDDRYGLLLTALNDGANATFTSEVKGKFNMDFAVYSQASFTGEVAEAVYKNDYADIQELTVSFTDLINPDNSFDVIFSAGSNGNCVTPTARIRAHGQEAAVVSHGNKYSALSATYNSNGVYTRIEGASFCNRAYKGGELTDNVGSITLSFDPDTMSVYVKSNGGNEIIVWNFFNAVNDTKNIGFTLDKIEKYSVSVIFSDIIDGREANLILYSINGRDTSWHYLANDEAVGFVADVDFNAIVGQAYNIPMPRFSDNFAGGEVTVVGPITNDVFELQEGLTFTPIFAGTYSIIYNCVSDKGVNTSVKYSIEAYNEVDEASFNFSSVLYGNERYGTGSTVKLPSVVVSGGLLRRDLSALFKVVYNGEVLSDYDKITDFGTTFTFTEAGNYVLSFISPDGSVQKDYSYEIVDNLPVFGVLDFPYEVAYNETFTVPKWTITENGSKCFYSVKTTMPSGTELFGESVLTDELGLYEVTYIVEYGNSKTAEYTRVFNAKYRTTNAFVSSNISFTTQIGSPWFNNAHNGLIISAESSFETQYNHVIDLSDNTKDDLLLELMVIPDIVGVENFSSMVITFTDVDNDKNYFAVNVLSGSVSGNSIWSVYVKANAPDQQPSGWSDAVKTKLYVGGQYGFYSEFSFSGKYSSTDATNQTIRFYYDNDERAVYFCTSKNTKNLIVDFDDPACFANVWGGLTSGKVKMSIQPGRYSQGKASMLIMSVDGIDLSKEFMSESEKPFILVDMEGYTEINLPFAVVGKEYNLFSAQAYSNLQGIVPCDTKVYLNYGKAQQQEIDISQGFVPAVAGEYSVVYSTTDAYGVYNEKVLSINCKSASAYTAITSNISSADNRTLSVGEKAYVKDIVAQGGSGYLAVEIYIENSITGEKIDFDANGKFIIEKAGLYAVFYIVQDYLGTEEMFFYTIDCQISNKPIVNEDVSLPNGLICGFEYELPEIVAYDYSLEGQKYRARYSIFVLNTNGDVLETLGADRLYTPVTAHGDAVVIRYFVGGASGFVIKEYEVPLVDAVNFEDYSVDKTKLFVGNDVGNVVAGEGFVSFEVVDGSKIAYVNSLTENNVNFNVGVICDENDYFDYITVYLTDKKNPDERLRFDIVFTAGNVLSAKIYNNGDRSLKPIEMEGTDFEAFIEYGFIYNLTYKKLCDGKGASLFVFETTENYGEFNGFTSQEVNVEFVIHGVTGNPKFVVTKIGGYAIDESIEDMSAPTIVFKNELVGRAILGKKVLIPAVIADDVVSAVSEVTVSVTFNGRAVKDVNGNDIRNVNAKTSYKMFVNATGDYMVVYTYQDAFGNVGTYKKMIHVYETDAPTITVTGKVMAKYSVGDTITVPDYTVTDENTPSENIMSEVFIIKPTGLPIAIKEAGKYKFESSGKYILRLVAYDEFYNYMIINYTIEVVA